MGDLQESLPKMQKGMVLYSLNTVWIKCWRSHSLAKLPCCCPCCLQILFVKLSEGNSPTVFLLWFAKFFRDSTITSNSKSTLSHLISASMITQTLTMLWMCDKRCSLLPKLHIHLVFLVTDSHMKLSLSMVKESEQQTDCKNSSVCCDISSLFLTRDPLLLWS